MNRVDLRSIRWLNAASISAFGILLAAALLRLQPALLEMLELRSYDLRFASRGPREHSPAIALARIDEHSLDTLGKWPWPRTRFAELIDALSRGGALAIGFDAGFWEPDENSELRFVERMRASLDGLGIRDPRLDALLAQARAGADHDQALADAMRRSSAPVVLGYFFHMPGEDPRAAEGAPGGIDPEEAARRIDALRAAQYPLVLEQDPDRRPALTTAVAPEVNLPVLLEAAASSGYFDVQQDPDGVVRWMPMVIQAGDALFPPLSVATVWQALGRPRLQVDIASEGVKGIRIGPRFVPTDEQGRLLIDYAGPRFTFPSWSIADIVAGAVPEDAFRDRIVLVGATATALYDMRSTPFGHVFPGVEIHANVIDDILTGRFLTRPAWSEIFDLLAIAVLGGAIGLILPRANARVGLLALAGLAVGYVLLAQWAFAWRGMWLGVVYPLFGLGANYLLLTLYYYVAETRERKRIHGAFGRYVAPAVVDQMLAEPGRLELGGEEKILTVLFSDLAGFTAYSERYPPRELIGMLSEYYARMTEPIFAQHGMLKEYVGDELMAIFGAPLDQPDHAARACAAALEMRAVRQQLNDEWVRMGRHPLHARTGINSGVMLVGNVGSVYRFSYGALGDEVNLGSRLEGLNKIYRSEILVGENTVAMVGDAFRLREVDLVRVVGRKQPTRIYELLARSGEALPEARELALMAYAEALRAYRERRFEDARARLDACLTAWPDDGPARTLRERCAELLTRPPPEDWEGVYQATSKK
jgi:adenylate cyclase